jgi:solute carrier family 13 (sodium-dependent dicarboxylate transporter), member 2/3/5
MNRTSTSPKLNPLDMSSFNVGKLPEKESSRMAIWLGRSGALLALLVFILLKFVVDIPFLQNVDPGILTKKVKLLYDSIGHASFVSINTSMLAIFAASLILWVTEAIPLYLTSLILIIALVLSGVLSEVEAYHQLGHKVMWLNILSFVLAGVLVKTGIAKRFALWFVLKFGKSASMIFISFIIINFVLAAFISATTAKAAILLPVFMLIAAIYGARGGKHRNNFGRNIVLQNLLQINMSASGFVTGSGANLLAAALIGAAVGSDIFFTDWMIVGFPIAFVVLLIGWFVGTRIYFPLSPEEKKPNIEGGMEYLAVEYRKLGKIKFDEVKSILIFAGVLLLWVTDRWHGISATAVAFLGAVVSLFPGIGVVKWNDLDIPWHLLLFSAGAYTLGAGLDVTGLPMICVNASFNAMSFDAQTPFWLLYIILTSAMMFSALVFESKTMRAMLFIPIAIGVAQKFGYPVMSLAFPMALLIEHVYVFPFNSKPAALLYVTDQYSLYDTFKFGITMMIISWVLNIVMAMTYFRLMGVTPDGLNIF